MIDQQNETSHIDKFIVSTARHMAWDDARLHLELGRAWSEDLLQKNAVEYSRFHPLDNPSEEQRKLFEIAFMSCYRQEVQRRTRIARKLPMRVKDISNQLIACGGYIWTRQELYKDLLCTCPDGAEMYAFRLLSEYKNGDW
jgi:hypothetical protein